MGVWVSLFILSFLFGQFPNVFHFKYERASSANLWVNIHLLYALPRNILATIADS